MAIEYIRRAIGLNGTEALFHNNLGEACLALGSMPEAVACYCRALELTAGLCRGAQQPGNAVKDQGKLDDAVACYRRALELGPDFAEVAPSNLGNAFQGARGS